MKTNDAYREALARAKVSPAVIRALGAPVREGLFVSGSCAGSGPSGRAELGKSRVRAEGEGDDIRSRANRRALDLYPQSRWRLMKPRRGSTSLLRASPAVPRGNSAKGA